MKQVKSSIYDTDYYHRVYGSVSTSSPSTVDKLAAYHRDIIKICPPQKNNFLVDFGCGNGNLSFYLSQKYPVRILGIDYSPSAIKICRLYLKKLKQSTSTTPKLNFKNLNNHQLPDLKKVDIVYLCDVVEHMYDKEIKTVFRKFLSWNPNIKIVIHTDNLIYLKFVRPIFDIFSLFLGHFPISQFKQRHLVESQVHVNLTTPNNFRKKMAQLGLSEIRRSYPTVTLKRVSDQLGPLSQFKFLVKIVALLLKFFGFLSPSFFAVYQQSFKND